MRSPEMHNDIHNTDFVCVIFVMFGSLAEWCRRLPAVLNTGPLLVIFILCLATYS